MFPQEKFSMFSSSCHSGVTWTGSHTNSRVSEFCLRFQKFWTPNCSSERKRISSYFFLTATEQCYPLQFSPILAEQGTMSHSLHTCQLLFRSTNLHKGKLNISTNSPFKSQEDCVTECASGHGTLKKSP